MLFGIFLATIGAAAADAAAQPLGLTAPAPVGAPHFCPENQYPISALQTGTEGSTVLQFTITPEGRVANISVRNSSGSTDLDSASMTCAGNWLYRPAIENGVAVSVPWVAQVRWKINTTEPFMAIDRASYECVTADPATRKQVKEAPLRVVVRVHFKNQSIGSVALVASSGDPDLDRKVESCYENLPPKLAASIPGEVDDCPSR